MDKRIELPRYVTDVDHGVSDLVVDQQLSLDVAETVDAEPKGCYLAAYRTVIEGILEDAIYVEGYVTDPRLPIPIAHAWVEWGEDRLVDPVYCSFSPEPGRRYFPAIRLSAEEMEELNEAYPDEYLPYSENCLEQPELQDAAAAARYAAYEHIQPGLGAQIRQMEEQVRDHNREVCERAREAKEAGDVV